MGAAPKALKRQFLTGVLMKRKRNGVQPGFCGRATKMTPNFLYNYEKKAAKNQSTCFFEFFARIIPAKNAVNGAVAARPKLPATVFIISAAT